MIVQFVINGIISGILYSLLAIGFALVYNTTKVFHIVAAAIYVFAAYMFYLFTATFGLPIIISAFVAVILTMGLSLLTDVSGSKILSVAFEFIKSQGFPMIGMMTVIINLLAMIFGNEAKIIDSTEGSPFLMGELTITAKQMWQLGIGAAMLILFLLFIGISNWGVRFRALSANNILYETLGYNTSNTRTMVLLTSGAFIAFASCLTVYDGGLDPHVGMDVLISAIVAMILGGTGRFGTCALGGITLGVLQALAVYQFSSNWQNAVTFILLLILLFLRPQGIAGYKQRTV